MSTKLKEIKSEFSVVLKERSAIDMVIIPVIFLVTNILLGLTTAILTSLLFSLAALLYRLIKGGEGKYSAFGILGTLFLFVIISQSGQPRLLFTPSIISSVVAALACLVSVILRRPLVAYTSHLTRKWPLSWYMHPKIRVSYNEVTVFWFLYFTIRFLIQFQSFSLASTKLLATINTLAGWPSTIILLVISYLYGSWRLKRLKGPSVEEYLSGKKPPWKGQRKGF